MTEFRGTDLLAEVNSVLLCGCWLTETIHLQTPEYRFYENLDSNQGISFP